MGTNGSHRLWLKAVVLGTIISVVSGAFAVADQAQVDNDLAGSGLQNTVSLNAEPGAPVSTSAQVLVDFQGSNHVPAGASVTFAVNTAQTDLPSGYSVTNAVVAIPSPWSNTAGPDADGIVSATSAIDFTAPSVEDDYVYTVKWAHNVSPACSDSNCLTGSPAFTINLHVEDTTSPPTNVPPAADAGGPYSGDEGSDVAIDGTGSSDTDGSVASYAWTATPQSGGVNDPDAGASCSLDDATASTTNVSCTDDGIYDIELTVTDDGGDSDSDETTLTLGNAAPEITAASFGGAAASCSVGGADNVALTVNFTDAGSNDTHKVHVDWNNDGTDDETVDPFASGGDPIGHIYNAGVHTAKITVEDDDGDTDSATANVTVNYDTSGILQPVNWTQAHNDPSIFKYGQTLPVKVRFTDCAGTPVSTLTVNVSVKKISGSTDPSGDNEYISNTNTPDSGGVMRSDGTSLYLYNLATKSLGDSTATYEITLTVASTSQTVKTLFGTRAK